MKKFTHPGNFFESPVTHFRVFLAFLLLFAVNLIVNAQCSLPTEDLIKESVDENCEFLVDYTTFLTDDGAACSTNPDDYHVYIYESDKSTLWIDGQGQINVPSGYKSTTLYGVLKYTKGVGNSTGFIPIQVNDKMDPVVECYTPLVAYEGEIDGTEDQYDRTSTPNDITQGCIAGGTVMVYYDTIRFTVDKADTYNFFLDGADPDARFFIALYDETMDLATDPCQGFIFDYTAEAAGLPNTDSISVEKELLEVGKDYFMVVTTATPAGRGKYSLTIEGKDGGRALTKVEDCDYGTLFCFENLDEKVVILGNDACNGLLDNVTLVNEVITENKNCKKWKKDTLAQVVRDYKVADENGNTSIKTVTIYVKSISEDLLNLISISENFKCDEDNPISCSADYPKDAEGNPSPDHCGWPVLMYKGKEIALNNDCNKNNCLGIFYSDMEINNSCTPCTKRIMRKWTVISETCSGTEQKDFIQTIDISDKTAPEVTCPTNQEVTMNFNCEAKFQLPNPEATDNCQSDITWNVSVKDSNNNPVQYVADAYTKGEVLLPGGKDSIIYTISDGCGNDTLCKFVVEVEDLTPPVAVCQTFTTVSVGADGTGNLPAYALNSGSYDNCGTIKSFKVKRMGEPNSAFGDFVQFDCADLTPVPPHHMVVLQVEDQKGNKATCMVTAEIQDKLPATITCPADVEVECDYVYADNDLDTYFGTATVRDNCESSLEITTKVKNENGACFEDIIKKITRKFYVSQGGIAKDSCKQTISFKHGDYFGYDATGATTDDANGAIKWPQDVTVEGCFSLGYDADPNSPLHPNNSGRAEITEGPCDVVGVAYEDYKFADNGNPSAGGSFCFKIIRTWTVLDNCHKVDGRFANWTHQQVLFVNDYVDPVVEEIKDTVAEVFLPDCEPDTKAEIALKYGFEDNCTQKENLRWKYSIDYNNDGTWDYESPVGVEDTMRLVDLFTVGTHKIRWQSWDQCGNSVTNDQLVKIVNKVLPTFICIKPKVVLNQNGEKFVKANVGVSCCCTEHPCGYPLTFSFSQNPTDNIKHYDCSYIDTYDVGDDLINIGTDNVTIWVTVEMPDGTLVQDFCKTTIEIQDNKDACPNPNDPNGLQPVVSGMITNVNNEPIEGVEIDLVGSEQNSQVTNSEGRYEFYPVNKGDSYTVSPRTGNDYMNGLSTIDLVLIQKHILQIDEIDSPYLLLASDANNDDRVTAADVLILRKLILGITEELPGRKSWKYISKDVEFDNNSRPFNSYEGNQFEINSISGDVTVDYYGVKIGDINMSAYSDVESRSANDLILSVDDKDFVANDEVKIDFYAKDFNGIQGFQGTFNFDNNVMEFVSIESGVLEVNNSNIALNRLAEGQIPFSWFKSSAIDVEDDAVLFTANFKALNQGSVKSAISFNSDVTKLEAYNAQLENMDMILNYRNDVSGFELLQNIPNPFNNDTEIRFNIDSESQYNVTIFNVEGRVVYQKSGIAQKGMNSISVTRGDINVAGVLYYTVSTDKYSATRKMVVLK